MGSAILIFILLGLLFIGMGIYCYWAKEAVSFWANIERPLMNQVKEYNRKVGNLWIVYGLSFVILALPFRAGQNSGWIVISVLGVVFMTLWLMIMYSLLESKYRKD